MAGMADATVVVETMAKGGSLISAKLAGYDRDVFAVPGRTIDSKSAGCNDLIQNNKVIILTKPMTCWM